MKTLLDLASLNDAPFREATYSTSLCSALSPPWPCLSQLLNLYSLSSAPTQVKHPNISPLAPASKSPM